MSHERCALWAGMGTGKTIAVVHTLDLLRLCGELAKGPALVIGPMRVARDTWPDEIAKWDQFKHIQVTSLACGPEERLRRLKLDSQITTVSYNMIPWLVEHFKGKWPFRTVIADESDYLKGFREKSGGEGRFASDKSGSSGIRAYHLARVAHSIVKRWVNLSGAPSPNGLLDLWGQTWYIDKGERLGRTFGAYKQRWFRPKFTGRGIEALPGAGDQINALLRDICLTIDPHDYYDLKESIHTRINVKLPDNIRAIYEQMEREAYAKLLSGEEIEVFDGGSATNKCLQILNGAVYTHKPQQGAWEALHDRKLEALESVMHECGNVQMLVSYSYVPDKLRILQKFKSAADISTTQGMRAFKSGNVQLGVAHPDSMGHGVDGLQKNTNILVRFGHTWKPGPNVQFVERIGPMRQHQAGFDRPTYIYDLCVEDSLDDVVIASRTTKLGVMDTTMNYMKRKYGGPNA